MKKILYITAAAIGAALALGGFAACSDDDGDDDNQSQETGGTSLESFSLLKGAYLEGLSEITIPVELNDDGKSKLQKDGDVSAYFSATQSAARSARAVSDATLSDFSAKVSAVTDSGIVVSLSGKLKSEDYRLALKAAIPAEATKSGSAESVDALTVHVGSAATISEDSLDLSEKTVPTAAELAKKTFKYTQMNSATGYKIVYYQFNGDGSSATQTTVETDSKEEVKNRTVVFKTVPYDATNGSLPLYHQGHGSDKKSEYDSVDGLNPDKMTLCKIDGNYYFYATDDGDYLTPKSEGNTLFAEYAQTDGTTITLSTDGTITGVWYNTEGDEDDEENPPTETTGTIEGSFVNNGGVVMISFAVIVEGEEPEPLLDESFIYDGTKLLDGGEFTEYLGTVPAPSAD